MNKELLKITEDNVEKICVKAFFEILNVFDIRQIEDLENKQITISLVQLHNYNEEKLLWLNNFLKHRNEIIDILKKKEIKLLEKELL